MEMEMEEEGESRVVLPCSEEEGHQCLSDCLHELSRVRVTFVVVLVMVVVLYLCF